MMVSDILSVKVSGIINKKVVIGTNEKNNKANDVNFWPFLLVKLKKYRRHKIYFKFFQKYCCKMEKSKISKIQKNESVLYRGFGGLKVMC